MTTDFSCDPTGARFISELTLENFLAPVWREFIFLKKKIFFFSKFLKKFFLIKKIWTIFDTPYQKEKSHKIFVTNWTGFWHAPPEGEYFFVQKLVPENTHSVTVPFSFWESNNLFWRAEKILWSLWNLLFLKQGIACVFYMTHLGCLHVDFLFRQCGMESFLNRFLLPIKGKWPQILGVTPLGRDLFQS